jgi:hypothetical protein
MKTAAVALVLTILFAVPHAGGEEKPAGPIPATVRIIRASGSHGVNLLAGEWHIPAAKDLEKILGKLEATPGLETQTSSRIPRRGKGTEISATLLNRLRYVQDFEVETTAQGEKPVPIHATIKDGVIAELEARADPDGEAVVFVAKLTVATLITPMPKFETKLAGENVTIQLPEIMVRRFTKNVRVPVGRSAILPADSTTFLVVTAHAPGEKAAGKVGLQPR